MISPSLLRARATAALAAAGLMLSLASCTPASDGPAVSTPSKALPGLPSTHIHGMAVNDKTGQLLLATHEACSTSPAPLPSKSARAMI